MHYKSSGFFLIEVLVASALLLIMLHIGYSLGTQAVGCYQQTIKTLHDIQSKQRLLGDYHHRDKEIIYAKTSP